MIGEKSSVK